MRVLHVQKVKGIGGSERHLLTLLPALAARGMDVRMSVLGTADFMTFVHQMRAEGIDTLVRAAKAHVQPELIPWLATEIRGFRPDLVHTHLVHADAYGQIAARLARVPGVSSVHSTHDFYRRQPYLAVGRGVARLARRSIAISHHVRAFLEELRLARPERIRVIPYGINTSHWMFTPSERRQAREAYGLGPSDVAIGIASRLIPYKGHDFLIRAMRLAVADDPNLRLLIAGEGPMRQRLEQAAGALPSGTARFLGFVGDVRSFMNACDIVTIPTLPELSEGFGLAALEAMAAARPVVATNVGSLPEIVVSGETGTLVTPGDVQELALVLLHLARDSPLRLSMSERGRQRAQRTFDLSSMADRTVQVYREALDGSRDLESGPSNSG
jgi:glycosyltransferase involved in cell wall biosynthesis